MTQEDLSSPPVSCWIMLSQLTFMMNPEEKPASVSEVELRKNETFSRHTLVTVTEFVVLTF